MIQNLRIILMLKSKLPNAISLNNQKKPKTVLNTDNAMPFPQFEYEKLAELFVPKYFLNYKISIKSIHTDTQITILIGAQITILSDTSLH
jgi:hypothetical protein